MHTINNASHQFPMIPTKARQSSTEQQPFKYHLKVIQISECICINKHSHIRSSFLYLPWLMEVLVFKKAKQKWFIYYITAKAHSSIFLNRLSAFSFKKQIKNSSFTTITGENRKLDIAKICFSLHTILNYILL